MHLPEGLWRAKIQAVPESVRSAIQSYLNRLNTMAEEGAGLLLWGDPGVGKTGAASVIAKEARARGFTAYFTTVNNLRDAIREHRMFDESMTVVERCREVDILILDNLTEGDAAERFVDLRFIEDLLTSRGTNLRISILTTRLSWTTLLIKYESFLRTITGHLVELEVKGPDLREKHGEFLRDVVLGTGSET